MLELSGVSASYQTNDGLVPAVRDINLTVQANEVLGLAGESGCGKSSLLKVMYGDLRTSLRLVDGTVTLDTGSVQRRNEQIRTEWWKAVSYVPQGAMSVLNPLARVESQFLDSVKSTGKGNRKALREQVKDYLTGFGLPASVLRAYPHQLSGGMRQRVTIAMATFSQPSVVLADEPTTGLDVVVQRGILTLLAAWQQRTKHTLVIVSHDMGVHYQVTDRLAVMYAGRIVERAQTDRIFATPLHPYTRALIESLPRIGDAERRRGLGGILPRGKAVTAGCPFAGRVRQ